MTASVHCACDRGMAGEGSAGGEVKSPALVLAVSILASSLAFVDGSVVNVGLPAIGRSLPGAVGDLPWVVNAYLLPLSALLLIGGAAGDRFGRRRLLVIGTALFAVSSGACAIAPTLPTLMAARAAQGAGAALLMPNSLAILGASFPGDKRGRAVGTWSAAGAMTAAGGPVLGGWLIDSVGWRAIFLINLPLALGAIALAFVAIPKDVRDAAAPPLDLLGAALATSALGALTWGLTEGSGPRGFGGAPILAIAAGLGLLVGFVLVERARGDRAMMPLALFGSRTFTGLSLLTLLLYGALGGLLVLVPYVLIRADGYAATAAGAALLPFPAVLACASPVMGGVVDRIGARIPLTVGPMIVAAGFLLATRIGGPGGYWLTAFPAILVIALGMAGAVAPLTTAVLGSVDKQHTGSASGFNSALARAGGLTATAVLGGVLALRGPALVGGFHGAAVAGAGLALAAAASAFLLVQPRSKRSGD